MLGTPEGVSLDPDQLNELFERLQGSDMTEGLRNHRNHPDRDLFRWPIIASRVPDAPISMLERMAVDKAISDGIAMVRSEVGRTGSETRPIDTDIHFAALTDVLLPHAQSSEQVAKLVSGYVRTQFQLLMKASVAVSIPGQDSTAQELEQAIIEATPERWANLTELSRVPEWIVFRHALETRAFETYALAPGNDSVFTLLADPEEVFLLDFAPEEEDGEIPKIRRNTPDDKRMTRAKMARFFQFPGLYELIEKDAYEMHPAAAGDNLTILAEYICEQDEDSVARLNRVLPEDIEKWISEKLTKYTPPIEVAWYLWKRLNGTEYGVAARSVEQYILDIHEDKHPWLFQLGMKGRDQCRHIGGVFELYQFSLMSCQYAMDDATKGKYPELLAILPSIYNLQTVQANPAYAGLESVGYVLRHYSENITDFYPEAEAVKGVDLSTGSLEPIRELLDYESELDEYAWRAYEGFELLDPIEIFKAHSINGYEAVSQLSKVIFEKIRDLAEKDASILLRFKQEVLDKLEPCKRRVLVELMESLAMPIAAESLLAESDADTVVEIARGTKAVKLPPRIILPGDVAWDEVVGTSFDPTKISTVAERELLRRSLKGARGATEISEYLMSHVDTLRPSEVVRPRPDAPHGDIISEYGESPDLLSLLDMATLLLYMGYDPDEVKAEIARLAEIADSMSRPELALVGTESEMLGATPEGPIIDDQAFSWLFNVLPRDRKPTDWEDNETMLPPTTTPFMQSMLLSLVADKRFPFLNTDLFWEQTDRPDRSPNSLHLNVSIPEGLPFTGAFIDRYMEAIQRMQWLAYGGDLVQRKIAKGRTSHWRRHSLLDVVGGIDKRTKVEIRNLRMERDGSNNIRAYQLQFLASACIQLMREQAGLKLSQSGRVMAEIYQRFQVESQRIKGSEQGAAILAEQLIVRYAGEVQNELGITLKPKKEGIIISP